MDILIAGYSAFFISGIRPDIWFHLPDIRLEKLFEIKNFPDVKHVMMSFFDGKKCWVSEIVWYHVDIQNLFISKRFFISKKLDIKNIWYQKFFDIENFADTNISISKKLRSTKFGDTQKIVISASLWYQKFSHQHDNQGKKSKIYGSWHGGQQQ